MLSNPGQTTRAPRILAGGQYICAGDASRITIARRRVFEFGERGRTHEGGISRPTYTRALLDEHNEETKADFIW